MKDKIYKKAFIIGITSILIRIIGMLALFPFTKIIGSDGVKIYNLAFIPLAFFKEIETLGIFPATSKLASGKSSNDKIEFYNNVKAKLTKLGIIFFILNIILSFPISLLYNNGDKSVLILIIIGGISLILNPKYMFNKGFLMADLRVGINSFINMIEQLIRVLILLLGSYFLMKVNLMYALTSAILSIPISEGIGYIISKIFLRKYKSSSFNKINTKDFTYSRINIGITTSFLSIFNMIDSLTYMKLSSSENKSLLFASISFYASRIIMIPILIIQSLASVSIPSLYKENKIYKNEKSLEMMKFSLMFLIGVAFFIHFYNDEVFNFLFDYNKHSAKILKEVVINMIFFGILKLSIGNLESRKIKTNMIVFTSISYLIKIILNIILIRYIDYKGLIISSLLSVILIQFIISRYLRKEGFRFSGIFKTIIMSSIISVYGILLIKYMNIHIIIKGLIYITTYLILILITYKHKNHILEWK